jgi:hypothetical protein
MDIHLHPRHKQIICFALNFLEANMDYISDMLEENPSEIVGSNVGHNEIDDLVKMFGADNY